MENPVLKPLWNSNNVGAGARYDPTRMLELRFSPTPIIRIYRHTLKLGPLGSDHGQVKRDKKKDEKMARFIAGINFGRSWTLQSIYLQFTLIGRAFTRPTRDYTESISIWGVCYPVEASKGSLSTKGKTKLSLSLFVAGGGGEQKRGLL